MSLSRSVREKLRHVLLDQRLARIDAVARELEDLRRERAEVARQVPTWDRVYVFDDTPDEARLHAIDLALEPRSEVLGQLRAEVQADLVEVGEEFPPFGVGVAIERAFSLTARELQPGPTWARDRAELCELLGSIADRIARRWVPDFDPGALERELSDEARCRSVAAGQKTELRAHGILGTAPIRHAELLPLVAQRLLDSDFFASRTAQREAERIYEQALKAATDASGRIPLLERLNPFSEGPAQVAHSERQEDLARAEEVLRRAVESSLAQLHEALGAYPPLLVHQRALEALGVASLLRVERVPTLNEQGQRREREVVVPRALALAALRRLIEAFDAAFPGVPLPLSLSQERSAIGARRRSPREHLERAVFTALEEGWALDLRQRALEQAALLGMAERDLGARRVSWLGRLGLAPVESQAERRAWHEAAATDCWRQLLAHTRRQCETLAPLATRDLVLRAARALTEVRTDAGETRVPRECRVHGLPTLRSALRAIERALGSHYDLSGTPLELLRDVADADPSESEPIPQAPFEPLSRAELVSRLVGWFPSGLRERLDVLGPVEPEEWFAVRLTPGEEDAPEARESALRELQRELAAALAAAYPPARLYFAIPRVERAVDAMVASCDERQVEISGALEPRYVCEIQGQAPAVEAMRAFGRLVRDTYGDLPDAHELLFVWERSEVVESSWLAE